MSGDNAAENGVFIDDNNFDDIVDAERNNVAAEMPVHNVSRPLSDETSQFAKLQRALRNESGAIDLSDEFESNVALFVYAGDHRTPPNDADPLAQVMQSADKRHWYVFDNNANIDANEGGSDTDCRAPLVHFDAKEMPVCHRRIDRDAIGEAIYLALWLAAQNARNAEKLSAFVTGYKVYKDERDTPEANVLASGVLDSAQILQSGESDENSNDERDLPNKRNNNAQVSERKEAVPGPNSRVWLLWLIGGTVLALVAAVIVYFVALRKRAKDAKSKPALKSADELPTENRAARREADDLARSAAESREPGILLGNV